MFIIVGLFVFMYILAYIFLRNYSYHDTNNSTFGTIGYSAFTYFDKKYARVYPVSKADAEWILINKSNFSVENYMALIVFVPLERLELVIRGKRVAKLTNEEINEVKHRIETVPTKIKDSPY